MFEPYIKIFLKNGKVSCSIKGNENDVDILASALFHKGFIKYIGQVIKEKFPESELGSGVQNNAEAYLSIEENGPIIRPENVLNRLDRPGGV